MRYNPNGADRRDLRQVRRAPYIDHDWGLGRPSHGVGNDNFSERYRGWLRPPSAGRYAFRVEVDDFGWLSLDGKLVAGPAKEEGDNHLFHGEIDLPDRPVPLRLDCRERHYNAHGRLLWRRADSNGPFQPVPHEALFLDRESAEKAPPPLDPEVPRGVTLTVLHGETGKLIVAPMVRPHVDVVLQKSNRPYQDLDWGLLPGGAPLLLRYTGLIETPRPGRHTLHVTGKGRARLWVDGREVHGPTHEVDLPEGPISLRLDYLTRTDELVAGLAEKPMELAWTRAGDDAPTPVLVPQAVLFPHEAAARRVEGSGGLTELHFADRDFGRVVDSRVGAQVQLAGGESRAVRWEGALRAPAAGRYRLHLRANGGARLWVDGDLILDAAGSGEADAVATVTLPAGPVALRLDYVRGPSGEARCSLAWAPADHDGPAAPIPLARLIPAPPERDPWGLRPLVRGPGGQVLAFRGATVFRLERGGWKTVFDTAVHLGQRKRDGRVYFVSNVIWWLEDRLTMVKAPGRIRAAVPLPGGDCWVLIAGRVYHFAGDEFTPLAGDEIEGVAAGKGGVYALRRGRVCQYDGVKLDEISGPGHQALVAAEDGQAYALAGGAPYRVGRVGLTKVVAGSAPVEALAQTFDGRAYLLQGGRVYRFDGATRTAVTGPGHAALFLAGDAVIYALRGGELHRFYVSHWMPRGLLYGITSAVQSADGKAYVAARGALWHFEGERVERIDVAGRVLEITREPGGAMIVLVDGKRMRFDGRRCTPLAGSR